jgi:ribonuclease R
MTDEAILKVIARQPRHTAAYKQLLHDLGLHGNQRRELADRLRHLVKRGDLVEIGKDRFSIREAAAQKGLVAGRLSMHRDGYGFVTPEDEALRNRISGDIYIPAPAVGTAMHRDRVLVELGAARSGGRVEGRIARVLEREHDTVVGIFHYGERNNYVTPLDEKIRQEIVIAPGSELPAAEMGKEASRHRVLGDEVKRRSLAASGDLEGMAVDVEILQWPSPTQNPRGRVIEILGNQDDFGVDVEIIIRKYHLPHHFPSEVIAEAQAIPNVIAAQEVRARKDFRRVPIVTIDGETARDFDDAVSVRRLSNGNYELHVHIADVAHYVRPDTALDEEARRRGTSVYFPDRAVPMLPVELSTDLCSLRPQLDRLVLSCVMEMDPRGELVSYELSEGVIRSAERMTYTDVNLLLEGDAPLRLRYAPLVETFELMRELASALNRKRVRRGSIDFDLPEPVIEFDEQGLMQGVTRSERNFAHRLIEEFMLAANECVATHLEQNGVASLYRIHEKPDAKKIYDFETIAAAFGYSLGVGALPIQRMQMRSDKRSRHGTGRNPREIEIPQEVHITPRMYQKLTQKIAGKPEERILSFLMLRSLKQARYSEKNEGHFALAAPTYTHFTSPIRRYPDLIVHRILKEILRQPSHHGRQQHAVVAHNVDGEQAVSPWSKRRHPTTVSKGRPGKAELEGLISEGELHQIAETSSQAERRADDAERELMDWKKIKFMQERLGEEFPGLVISVTKYGLFVELEEMFIEGLVPLTSLAGDRFTYRENTREIIGERSRKTYSLGDRVRVIVDRIDRVLRKIQFALVEEQPSRAQRRHKHR